MSSAPPPGLPHSPSDVSAKSTLRLGHQLHVSFTALCDAALGTRPSLRSGEHFPAPQHGQGKQHEVRRDPKGAEMRVSLEGPRVVLRARWPSPPQSREGAVSTNPTEAPQTRSNRIPRGADAQLPKQATEGGPGGAKPRSLLDRLQWLKPCGKGTWTAVTAPRE